MAERKITTSNHSAKYRDTLSETFPPVMYADLPLLARVIFRRKFVFAAVMLISVILWFIYLLLKPPMFRSEILFSQPEIPRYTHLNNVTLADVRILPRELFFEYKSNLSAKSNQYSFLTENASKYFHNNPTFLQQDVKSNDVSPHRIGRFRSIERTWATEPKTLPTLLHGFFSNALHIKVSSELPERYFFYLTVEFPKMDISTDIATDYAAHINQLTVTDVKNRIYRRVNDQRAQIQNEISSEIDIARHERENLIVQLEEQALIADSLGYQESIKSSDDQVESTLLYFHGAKALRAQADILRHRTDDRPFSPKLAALESELGRLNNFPDKFPITHAAHITQSIDAVPNQANKQVLFTLTIALVLGLVVSSIYNIFDYYINS